MLLRADQEVAVILVLKQAQARQDTLLERSPIDSHASVGAM